MKELAPADRPREKLQRHGAAALGDNELVALVLGSGGSRGGALMVANGLLAAQGGLHGLARSTCDDLARAAGIGRAKAAQILAALELGRRTLTRRPQARLRLTTARDAAAFLMLLDTKHRVLRTTVLTLGTLNSSVVEPRDVYREAALGGAAAIVAFHNHPSGDPTPSPDDVVLTRRLAAAGVLMGIDLVDHIILGEVRYSSFKEMALL